jgi:hypothetical protein
MAKCLELFGYRQMGGINSAIVLNNNWKSLLRRVIWRPFSPGYLVGIDMPVEVPRLMVNRILRRTDNGQFLTGHLGYTFDLIDKIKDEGFTTLVVIRDPRAVLNSFVHYVIDSKRHPCHQSFLRMGLADRYLATLDGVVLPNMTVQPLAIRCRALDPWLEQEHSHIFRFEDLVGERGGSSREAQVHSLEVLAELLDLPRSKIDLVANQLHGPGRTTFRKGKVGSWKEEIPVHLLDEINDKLDTVLQKWGYL